MASVIREAVGRAHRQVDEASLAIERALAEVVSGDRDAINSIRLTEMRLKAALDATQQAYALLKNKQKS